jgi:hypothetical protein
MRPLWRDRAKPTTVDDNADRSLQQADRNNESFLVLVRKDHTRNARERPGFKQHPLSHRQCGEGRHSQAGVQHRQDGSHLIFFDGLRNSSKAHDVYHAWHDQNWKPIQRIETA